MPNSYKDLCKWVALIKGEILLEWMKQLWCVVCRKTPCTVWCGICTVIGSLNSMTKSSLWALLKTSLRFWKDKLVVLSSLTGKKYFAYRLLKIVWFYLLKGNCILFPKNSQCIMSCSTSFSVSMLMQLPLVHKIKPTWRLLA